MHVDCRFKAVALWHGQLYTGTVRRYPTKSEKPLSVTIPSFSLSSISHSAAFLLLLLLLLPFPLPLACFLFSAHSCRSIDLSLALPVFSFLSTEAAARCPRSTTCCDVQRALDDAPGQSKDSAHAAYAAVFRVIPYILFLMVGRDSRTLAHRPPRAESLSLVKRVPDPRTRADITPRKACPILPLRSCFPSLAWTCDAMRKRE